MSMTFEIACIDCRKQLWVGQTTRREGSCGLFLYGYADENGDMHLARFLKEHQGHELRFYCDDCTDEIQTSGGLLPTHMLDDEEGYKVVESDEIEPLVKKLMDLAEELPNFAKFRVRDAFDLGRSFEQENKGRDERRQEGSSE